MAFTYKIIENSISDDIIAFNKGFYSTSIATTKAYNIATHIV